MQRLSVLLLVTFGLVPSAFAATFCVTNNADPAPSTPGDCTSDCVADTNCSLREAIDQANLTPGTDTIVFAITGSSVITLAAGLADITDTLTIDGYSQAGAAPATDIAPATLKIELDGGSLMTAPPAIGLHFAAGAPGSVVKGLVIRMFNKSSHEAVRLDAANCALTGNHIGVDAAGTAAQPNARNIQLNGVSGTVIGGTAPADRNVIGGSTDAGIRISTAGSGTVIAGNYIGTNANGVGNLGNAFGIIVESTSNVVIGGTMPGARNIIAANKTAGIYVTGGANQGTLIRGNWVGLDALGMALPNATNDATGAGIVIHAGSGTTIGGSMPGAGNIVSGNARAGIRVNQFPTGTVIEGNSVGLDPTGSLARGNDSFGILLDSAVGTRIGGTAAGAGNSIANTVGGVGIGVRGAAATGNAFLANSVFDNSGVGIDLGTVGGVDGVTANDAGDADTGPNGLQNFPELSAAASVGGALRVSGTFDGSTGATYRIEFFSSPACEVGPAFHGEGKVFLGALTGVNTSLSGAVAFNAALPVVVPKGEAVTATATRDLGGGSFGDTSEFSTCQTVVTPGAIEVEALTYAAAEPATSVQLTAVRTGGSDGVVSAQVSVGGGTAVVGLDYPASSMQLSFADGEAVKSFAVDLLDDLVKDGAQTVLVTLSAPSGGAVVGAKAQATITLADNDRCGDGVVNADEGCDDGNTTSGDGCTAACVVEVCGDGVVNHNPNATTPNETCDGGGCAVGSECVACLCVAIVPPAEEEEVSEVPPVATTPRATGCGCGGAPAGDVGLVAALTALGLCARRRRRSID